MQNIYILRHFRVKDSINKKLDSKGFVDWVKEYDNSLLEYIDLELPKVDKIYSSTQNRAIKTAEYLKLDFEECDLLKEVEAAPFINTKFKFSKNFWIVMDRLFWFFNLSHKEPKRATLERVDKFLEIIKDQKSVLIVSHGLFIKVLVYRLKKWDIKVLVTSVQKMENCIVLRRQIEIKRSKYEL